MDLEQIDTDTYMYFLFPSRTRLDSLRDREQRHHHFEQEQKEVEEVNVRHHPNIQLALIDHVSIR
jgi:hypothetical protein